MKRTEAIKKVRETENAIEVQRLEKLRQMEADMDLENRESNRNRARSITVGTSFGGTSEIMMRGDGGRHLWCLMQPCEIVELIHQLAGNVGCNVSLKPRDDFASWRDWRVSEAEKKHLNGHAPFVNDMAVFQKLGASGYNDEEAKKIMDLLADVKEFANENDDAKIIFQETKGHGAPNLMVGEDDGLLHNKVAIVDKKIVYMAGGDGGDGNYENKERANEKVATKKTVNRRSSSEPQDLPDNWKNIFGLKGSLDRLGDLSWAGHSDLGWFEVDVPEPVFDQKKFVDDRIASYLNESLSMVAADNSSQTKAERQAWMDYRKKLQEIHLQPNYPNEVFWPARPE